MIRISLALVVFVVLVSCIDNTAPEQEPRAVVVVGADTSVSLSTIDTLCVHLTTRLWCDWGFESAQALLDTTHTQLVRADTGYSVHAWNFVAEGEGADTLLLSEFCLPPGDTLPQLGRTFTVLVDVANAPARE